jgi:photosystem II stability/assembly factor-like uncharacterized protein
MTPHRSNRQFSVLASTVALVAWAATPTAAQQQSGSLPMLEYSGKPISIPFRCSSEDFLPAGLTCSQTEPCPAYLEIASVDGAGERVVAAGNIHTDAVTLFSILLESRDSGKTWREPLERVRGAGLDRVQLMPDGSGWVSGEELYPTARNPFLGISAAGSSWQQVPVFGEAKLGDIYKFRFTSAKDGLLVVDRGPAAGNARYELYQSADGGASWSLKQGTEKPPDIGSEREGAVWRVLADAATQSFRIERRSTSSWETAAAFAVKAGVCKPESPPLEP